MVRADRRQEAAHAESTVVTTSEYAHTRRTPSGTWGAAPLL